MYENLKGKKLLVIGSSKMETNIVKAAQSLGVYVVVVDGNQKSETTFAKNIADESWDINYSKIEMISEKCKEIGIDGVIAGYSEFRVLAACKIANHIGKPFYATEEQIELTRNKCLFKNECEKYGIPVPKSYNLTTENIDTAINDVAFPVIVKPADYAGRKGITICDKREQLKEAFIYALGFSESKSVVVEEYVTGIEFCAIYSLDDGEISLSCFNEKYLNKDKERKSALCDLAITPSKYLDRYISSADKGVHDFLAGIGAKNGVAFFQGIINEEKCCIFEMGYRLNGGNDYFLVEQNNNISYMKMLISHSLTGDMGDDLSKDNPYFSKYCCNFILYSDSGVVEKAEFCGNENFPGIDEINIYAVKGMEYSADGTTQQKAFSFKISGNTIEDIKDIILYIENNIVLQDASGKNLLYNPFDVERLKNERKEN